MALNAEVGSATANSYVTLEEAEDYFEDRLHSELWSTSTEKEAALITASRTIDNMSSFVGVKTTTTQSMKFPRSGITLDDSTELDELTIPLEIKTATYEMAISSLASDRTADSDLAGIEMLKAGTLQIKATPGGYKSTTPDIIPDYIKQILAPFLSSDSFGVVRLVRA